MNDAINLYFLTSNKAKVKTMRRWIAPTNAKVYLKRPPANQPERKDDSTYHIDVIHRWHTDKSIRKKL